ncbi:malto-oligosyltrehalose synthase [Candidatus Marsarchaeota G2 archaeon OSP_D]|jgi:malto-oligosyltrehalose synthase|uniref:Malto-oligosyltrehalose synthase n=4 Tax=Candidatus Marsarchaeota group 2 TaxID=2203771 RepID=A0A2R6AY41_9ARCH|nr:MAG: malto-oligosyltrehalose synthase [Candidatus Marsarchaeota G2 archaeon OSP_D]
MRVLSTYRLQLNREFPFASVIGLLDHFSELGVTHLYLSPILKARPGSTHCYDVVDHSTINEELGGEQGYRTLLEEARKWGLGVIQDVVPNHMAVHQANWRLMDVLEKGVQSKYSDYFDIDWVSSKRVVLPILEADAEQLIRQGKIRLGLTQGVPSIICQDKCFPINQEGLDVLRHAGPIDDQTLDRLNTTLVKEVLARQYYTLSSSSDQPNYRRFFNVNELIGVNAEKKWVFDESHSIFSKLADLGVDGYRVDHIDGLMYPSSYLGWLHNLVGDAYVVVEKILTGDEELRRNWDCKGTTGYDFMNSVNQLFIDESSAFHFTRIYEEFIGRKIDFESLILEKRRFVIEHLLRAEFERVFREFAARIPNFDAIRERLLQFILRLPVYRTYIEATTISDEDIRLISSIDPDGLILSLIKKSRETFLKLQQILPAVTAKGYEDSVLFVYNRLISLNEVGGNPWIFGCGVNRFHEFNRRRLTHWPLSMSATSTHDSKLSEDVRCRLDVLSQMPTEWSSFIKELKNLLSPRIDPNDEYRLYQTLVGTWPKEGLSPDYRERVRSFTLKAMREAGENTSWVHPNTGYEERVLNLIDKLFERKDARLLIDRFVERVTPLGMLYSLSTLVLKMTSPGVPDIYQGCEVWRFLLTDPDNRRPVDFAHLRQVLKDVKEDSDAGSLMRDLYSGGIKMYVTTRLLHLRRGLPEVFQYGDYEPIPTTSKLVGYMRAKRVAVVVPRLVVSSAFPPIGQVWGDESIKIDAGNYVDVFTETEVKSNGYVPLSSVFSELPLAVLIKGK